ncbi:hypothetical protein TcasGA2_TC032372 [Tribolium castaneum]|uniref:Uncharacterized protein n=1 Tax=Tribolium castaneum TaxID=7070 RepID=A0A139WLC4_TRICA|nr:hypothetical protein TcasGA2_TC032372 [Tribolium castaneum]
MASTSLHHYEVQTQTSDVSHDGSMPYDLPTPDPLTRVEEMDQLSAFLHVLHAATTRHSILIYFIVALL